MRRYTQPANRKCGLEGETSAQAAARKHGLTVAEVEEWRDGFLLGAKSALRARPKDEDAPKDEQVKKLNQKVGELGLDLDLLKETPVGRAPTDRVSSARVWPILPLWLRHRVSHRALDGSPDSG